MPVAVPPVVSTGYQAHYAPHLVTKNPEFRVLEANDPKLEDKDANIACAYNPAHEIHMINKPMPKAGPGEVLIHVRSTGICGSDIHFWKHGHIGPTMVVRDECGAGHESAGEVIEVGQDVVALARGDRVAIEPGVPCGLSDCDFCKTGRYNACSRVVFFSTPPYHGTLTRFHAHPAGWAHKLPDNVSYEEGALCEPLAVALAAIERANIRLGDPILICGSGPIGLVTLLAANAAGCAPIVITDLFESRLKFAQNLVPRVKTVQIQRGQSEEDIAATVKEAAGLAFKVALECTGVESSIRAAIYSVKFGGTVFVTGVGPSEIKFPFGYVNANEIDMHFQYRYFNQYPRAIRLVSAGLIDMKPLVTHRFELAKAVDAFHIAADPTNGAIKVQIVD